MIRVIDKRGSPIRFMTSMITYRIGGHEVLLPINHNYNKICDILGFLKLRQKKFREFFISSENSPLSARVLSNYLGMMRTVLLVPKSGQLLGQLIANQI